MVWVVVVVMVICGGDDQFPKITALNLNGTAIASFRTVRWIDALMPNLEELCLAHCDLADLDTFDVDCEKATAAAAAAVLLLLHVVPQQQPMALPRLLC